MPRTLNTRPTSIYWIIDLRPETLASWPDGLPFYCGKTVIGAHIRFSKHRSDARKYPERNIAKRLNACGSHVAIRVVEVVAPDADWVDREKFWIRKLRSLYPDTVNVTAGGQGAAGYIASAEARAKQSAALKGRVFSDAHRARIGAASRNRSPEARIKMSAWQIGKKLSPEHRAKVSAAMKGRFVSAETRAKMSIASRKTPPESRARAGAKLKGRVFSPETLAKMSAAQKLRYQKLRAANARA